MFIYHYTYTKPYKILKNGLLCSYKSEDTESINEILNEAEEHPNWLDRSYCLFFQFQKETEVGEYIVTVDTDTLDSEELYVADLSIAQDIFNAIYYGREELFTTLTNKYWDSVMLLKDYLNGNIRFEKPEILYLSDISPNQIHCIEGI